MSTSHLQAWYTTMKPSSLSHCGPHPPKKLAAFFGECRGMQVTEFLAHTSYCHWLIHTDCNKLIVLEPQPQMSTECQSKRKFKNEIHLGKRWIEDCILSTIERHLLVVSNKLSKQANKFSVLQSQIQSPWLSAMSDRKLRGTGPGSGGNSK